VSWTKTKALCMFICRMQCVLYVMSRHSLGCLLFFSSSAGFGEESNIVIMVSGLHQHIVW